MASRSCAQDARKCWRMSSINTCSAGSGKEQIMIESTKSRRMIFTVLLMAVSFGCSNETKTTQPATPTKKEASVSETAFGQTPGGENVRVFTLTNAQGLEARIMTYGGIVISLRVPDRTGKLDDIALGYNSLDGYLKSTPYFGAIIGRYGNRIAKGRFTLNGKPYTLA